MAQITGAADPLVLASASPRRRELLERVGVVIEVRAADVDERTSASETAVQSACRLAVAKVEVVAALDTTRWVLAADTVVEIDGEILGKASDEADARGMISRLSGRVHRVTTAFSIRGPGGASVDRYVTTDVHIRVIADDEIAAYVQAGEWQGKAGAYAVQGMAAAFVSEVRGSISNVIGLPLAEVLHELRRCGAATPDYARGAPA